MSLETYRRAVQQFAPGSSASATSVARGQGAVSVHRGRTLEEARNAATRELGSDFTVLGTRRIPQGGVFGFFGAQEFELTALKKPESVKEANRSPFPEAERFEVANAASELASIRNEVRSEVRSLRSLLARASDAPQEASKRRSLESEIAELRETLAELQTDRNTPAQMKRRIASAGIEGLAARTIIARMRELGQKGSEDDLAQAIADLVGIGSWPLSGGGRSLIALVGPTGVGKTTTAAKLAAHAILNQGRSVSLISCDGFRVGATAQMERYAELLGADIHVANTASELEALVRKSKTDVTIVDTGGRGPAERNSVEAAIARLELGNDGRVSTKHTLLCSPACIRDTDARRSQRFFSACKPTGLVITKIDETSAPAGIVHAAIATGLPIAALCFGQRVPEDIAEATTDAIQDIFFAEKPSRKSRDRS